MSSVHHSEIRWTTNALVKSERERERYDENYSHYDDSAALVHHRRAHHNRLDRIRIASTSSSLLYSSSIERVRRTPFLRAHTGSFVDRLVSQRNSRHAGDLSHHSQSYSRCSLVMRVDLNWMRHMHGHVRHWQRADWRVRPPRQFTCVLRSSCRRIPTMYTDKQLPARTGEETRGRDDDAARALLTEHRCASIRHLTHSLLFSFISHRTGKLNTPQYYFIALAIPARVSSLAREINRHASISLI